MNDGVREIPQRFRASDGSEWPTAQEAKDRQELVDAANEHARASRRLGHLIAKRSLTADGQLFDFGLFREYWHVFEGGDWKPPAMRRLSFRGWGPEDFEVSGTQVRLVELEHDHRPVRSVIRSFEIGSLCAEKRAAEAALFDARVAWYCKRLSDQDGLWERVRAEMADG